MSEEEKRATALAPPDYDASRYPRPSVTVDVVILSIQGNDLKALLVQRGEPPYAGMWAIPGGFVRMDEDLLDAARRKLAEETGLHNVYLEQLYTFGAPDRDPRTRVITVAYFALVSGAMLRDQQLQASTDTSDVGWFSVYDLPPLAFDHAAIVEYALKRLRGKLTYTNIAAALLPPEFSLTELQKVYEIILHQPLDKRNFRKKMQPSDPPRPDDPSPLEHTGRTRMIGKHRPARLFRFRPDALDW